MDAVKPEISKAYLELDSGERHAFYYSPDAFAFAMRVPISSGALPVRVSFDLSVSEFLRIPTLRFGFGIFGPNDELRATGVSDLVGEDREFEWEVEGELPLTAQEMITAQMKSICTTLCEIAEMLHEQSGAN